MIGQDVTRENVTTRLVPIGCTVKKLLNWNNFVIRKLEWVFNNDHTKSLLNLVESVQRSFTKRIPGLNSLTYAQRLTSLQLQSLEHRRLISDLVMTFNIIHGNTALNFDDFFSFSTNLSSRGHPFKLNFPLFTNNNYKKHFFSSRIVPIWNALPINLVMAGSTQSFKRLIISHNFG